MPNFEQPLSRKADAVRRAKGLYKLYSESESENDLETLTRAMNANSLKLGDIGTNNKKHKKKIFPLLKQQEGHKKSNRYNNKPGRR